MLLKGERSLTDISRALKVSKPSAIKYMAGLEELGLISSRFNITETGREKIFQINEYSMVLSLDPDKGMITYTAEEAVDLQRPLVGQIEQKMFRDAVRTYVNEMVSSLKIKFTLIIFGSVARGEATSKSDIDILVMSEGVLSKKNRNTVMEALHKGSIATNIQVKPVFLDYNGFLESKGRFEMRIKNDGLIVYDLLDSDKVWKQMKRYWNITG